MDKLNELKKFMKSHAAGGYEHQNAYMLWKNILNKIDELQKVSTLSAEEENLIAEAGREGK